MLDILLKRFKRSKPTQHYFHTLIFEQKSGISLHLITAAMLLVLLIKALHLAAPHNLGKTFRLKTLNRSKVGKHGSAAGVQSIECCSLLQTTQISFITPRKFTTLLTSINFCCYISHILWRCRTMLFIKQTGGMLTNRHTVNGRSLNPSFMYITVRHRNITTNTKPAIAIFRNILYHTPHNIIYLNFIAQAILQGAQYWRTTPTPGTNRVGKHSNLHFLHSTKSFGLKKNKCRNEKVAKKRKDAQASFQNMN